MARSLKKGPYIDEKLVQRIRVIEATGEKRVVKTWSRASIISQQRRHEILAGK